MYIGTNTFKRLATARQGTGSTHAFGNTEERLIRSNVGVSARGTEGDDRWDPATGTGRVRAHQGDYDDAIRVKRNTFVLFLVNLFGGLAPGAVRHMYTLAQRARSLDRTLYPDRGATKYLPYWTQLLSAAIVTADARRCIRRLGGLQVQASGAALHAARRAAAARRP